MELDRCQENAVVASPKRGARGPIQLKWLHEAYGGCQGQASNRVLRFGSADADSALLLTKISIITPTCSKLVLSPCNLV